MPECTARAAVYLLPGQLPFEARLDLARLSLLNCIIHSENSLLLNVLRRQLAMKNMYSNSWFANVSSSIWPTMSTSLSVSHIKTPLIHLARY